MQVTLAEALLRRKELNDKLKGPLAQIKAASMVETKVTRKAAHEGVDDVIAQVVKLDAGQVTHEYDHHARALRLVDAAIQRANWETKVEVDAHVFADYVKPAKA